MPQDCDKHGRKSWGWLEYTAFQTNSKIVHKYNSHEIRIGQHGLPVDGYRRDTKTVYQFHGCIFHGHNCHLTKGSDYNPVNKKSYEELRTDTEAKDRYIKHLGYNLVVMRECQWDAFLQQNKTASDFVQELLSRTMTKRVSMTEKQIIQALLNGQFFGLIECDIEVPDHLYDKFSEMSPIFKNVTVSRNDLSDHMKSFVEETNCFSTPQKMLIGSMFGKQILLLSSLAKWYVEHGLVITHIYEIVQYKPSKVFEKFGKSVTDARRLGDVDSSKSLLADISKLVGKT